MDEFAKLFLRGRLADDMKKFMRIVRVFALAGLICMVLSALLSWQNVPLWAVAICSVAGFAADGVANVLDLMKPRRLYLLSVEQNEENALWRAGEERTRHAALFQAYLETFLGFSAGKRFWAIGLIRLLAPASLAAFCLLVSAGIVVDDVLALAFVAFALLSGCAGLYDTLLESRARARFYRIAQSAIDEVKREELNITAERAAKEAETARAGSAIPVPVELMLKENTEYEDYRAVNRKGSMVGILLGVLYFAVITIVISFGSNAEQLGEGANWAIVLSVFAAILIVSIVAVFPISRRQNEIFARNLLKLGDSEADKLRAELQRKWVASQRAGNIMFACFTAASVALGVALGLIGYFTNADGGMPLAQSVAVGVLPVLVYGALISLAVWVVMYYIARKRMRPIENKLREVLRTEIQ